MPAALLGVCAAAVVPKSICDRLIATTNAGRAVIFFAMTAKNEQRERPPLRDLFSDFELLISNFLLVILGSHGPKRCLYSIALINALTISAFWKLPLN